MNIKAFLIDDSAVVRKHVAELLQAAGITVCGSAADPIFAWPKMEADWPDVVVLDVEMPRMDGITFLKKLMTERPTPVVMCSTLTEQGARTTLQALAAGAVSFVTKPKIGLKEFLVDDANGLVAAVRAAARANLAALRHSAAMASAPASPRMAPAAGGTLAVARADAAAPECSGRVVAIGISTGGVQSLEAVLRQLPARSPGIVVVQHMPEKFTASFAARLSTVCAVQVAEARHGEPIVDGKVLIAPGGRHMQVRRHRDQLTADISDGPFINHHRPSIDVLFRAVARAVGPAAIGIVMTGMGDDGARGLLEMRRAGARTAAQDKASSVVFGMPAEAIRLDAAEDVVPLDDIAAWIGHMASSAVAA